jgi:hypothetical protein
LFSCLLRSFQHQMRCGTDYDGRWSYYRVRVVITQLSFSLLSMFSIDQCIHHVNFFCCILPPSC